MDNTDLNQVLDENETLSIRLGRLETALRLIARLPDRYLLGQTDWREIGQRAKQLADEALILLREAIAADGCPSCKRCGMPVRDRGLDHCRDCQSHGQGLRFKSPAERMVLGALEDPDRLKRIEDHQERIQHEMPTAICTAEQRAAGRLAQVARSFTDRFRCPLCSADQEVTRYRAKAGKRVMTRCRKCGRRSPAYVGFPSEITEGATATTAAG